MTTGRKRLPTLFENLTRMRTFFQLYETAARTKAEKNVSFAMTATTEKQKKIPHTISMEFGTYANNVTEVM